MGGGGRSFIYDRYEDFLKKQPAFTLAEVLITIVIIGVIAAVTIPAISANYSEHERISKIKKVYSTLSNAMTFVKANGGEDDLYIKTDNNQEAMNIWFDNHFKNILYTSKVCYFEEGCWLHDGIKQYNGKKLTILSNNTSRGLGNKVVTAVLSDGVLINIDDYAPNQAKAYWKINTNNQIMTLTFDINGDREPNTLGKDVFMLVYTKEYGLVPPYYMASQEDIDKDCSNSGYGFSCIQQYLNGSVR